MDLEKIEKLIVVFATGVILNKLLLINFKQSRYVHLYKCKYFIIPKNCIFKLMCYNYNTFLNINVYLL